MLRNICKSLVLLLLIFGAIAALPISISDNGNLEAKVVFDRGFTEIAIERLKYTWTIKNFNVDDYVNGQSVISPTFVTHDNCQWYLFTYPKGYDKRSEEYLSLFLFSVSCKIIANVRFSILNSNHKVINDKSFNYSFPKGDNIGMEKFVRQDFLLNTKNSLLEKNTLKIICEINATLSSTTDGSVKFKQHPETNDLGKDFEFLIDNEDFSDVKLSAGGQNLSALKGVLAARSPVFKSIFEFSTNVSQVDMSDVDADDVKEMLRYIYTGEVSNIAHFARNLLRLADSYELDGLKAICENSICTSLTIENAAEFYILGDAYFALNLKSQAKEFILFHISSVIVTPGFKSLIRTHPLLVKEIFSDMTKTKWQNNITNIKL